MSKDTSLTVSLFGRDISLSKSMEDAGKSAKTASDHFDDVAKKSAIALAAVGGAALLMAKGAAEDEQSAAQLANTLKNVVGATDATTKSVEDYISKATLSSGIADDQLRPAFQRLITSTKDVGEAQKLTNLAMEIATAKHIDVTAVSNALAKAHDGNLGALKRLGVSLDETTVKNKDFEGAVKELGDTFQGSLTANANTAAGKMEIFQNSMNEAKEAVGYAFLPILKQVGDTFQKIAPFITENSDLIGKVMIAVIALTGAIVIINGTIKAWEAATKAFTAVQAALNVVMEMNPIGLVVLAIAGLVAAIVIAYQHSETFRDIVKGAFEKVKEVVGDVMDFFKGALDLAKGALDGFGSAAKSVSGLVGDYFKLMASIIKLEINAVISVVNLAIRELNKIHVSIPSWVPGVGGKSFGINLPEIPKLAEGGIVTKPTIAMIGEAGAEAVIPLSKGMGGINVVVNVQGSVVQEQDLAVAVRDQIAILMRRRGLNPSILGV